MTQQSIADRRMVMAGEITELEALQGAAILDGAAFDPSTLWDKRAELEALGAAEAEAARRARNADALEAEEAREHSRAAAAIEHADLMKALAKAEKAFAGAVDAIGAVMASAERLRGLMRASGKAAPMFLDVMALKNALSRSMAAEMARLHGGTFRPAKFGHIQWRGVPPKPEWGKTKAEIRAVAALVEKET